MSQKNFLDKRGLTYFYDKINSSYLIKYQNMSTNKTDLAVIATKYDSTSTYSIGDYCVYQEKLYKCSTNIEIAETWNGQHWTEVTISDELENIYNLFEDVLLKPQVSGTQGQVLTADGQGGQSWEDSIASGIAASDANEDGNIIINNTINVELDERPIEDSVNGVTSGGVYDELENIRDNLSQKYEKPSGGIPASDLASGVIPNVPVQDVQVDGTSILNQGVVNVPVASNNDFGLVKVATSGNGITLDSNSKLQIDYASSGYIKAGSDARRPIVPWLQHESTFYGLAKAAGDSTQTQSDNTVGTYTDEAKSAIKNMLDITDGGIEVSDPNDNGILVFEELGNLNNTGIIADTYSNIATYEVGDYCIYEKRLYKCTSEISIAEEWNSSHWTIVNVGDELVNIKNGTVQDVQVNGTSVVMDGVANVPTANSQRYGAVRVGSGLYHDNGLIYVDASTDALIKSGDNVYRAIVPARQHQSTFYGLAKAAGADMASSNNAVGTYTDEAKVAIKSMLGVNDVVTDVTVSGTTPTITAVANTNYICGEVSTLDFTPSATGICNVIFESGSTATVLTLPNTVKMPEWFDSSTLEANTIYEISISNGIYGAVMSWQA